MGHFLLACVLIAIAVWIGGMVLWLSFLLLAGIVGIIAAIISAISEAIR
jgi:hypothetical protein